MTEGWASLAQEPVGEARQLQPLLTHSHPQVKPLYLSANSLSYTSRRCGWGVPGANYGLCGALKCSVFSQRWPCWLPLGGWSTVTQETQVGCTVFHLSSSPVLPHPAIIAQASWRWGQRSPTTQRGRGRLHQPVLSKNPSASRLSVLTGLASCEPPQRRSRTHRLRGTGPAPPCTAWINAGQKDLNSENLASGRLLRACLFLTVFGLEGEELAQIGELTYPQSPS